jgi:hypothetical protein
MQRTKTNSRCDRAPDETSALRRSHQRVPESVGGVLRSGGAPLDESVRRTLEPRFGHDFSSVRVHSGGDAARSAADVHARAWTVGNHIAFMPGAYSPRTRDGLHLLAHELTHVVQQSGIPAASGLSVGAEDHPSEREADAVASAMQRGDDASINVQSGAALRRRFLPQLPLPPKFARELLQWIGTHPANTELTKADTDTAEKVTGTKAPAKAASGAGTSPKFVLHDTDATMNMTHFSQQIGKKGPQGAGAVAWVPMQEKKTAFNKDTKKMETTTIDRDPVVTREFFEEKRPTTTGFEKGDDLIAESTRNADFSLIWGATAKSERGPALDRAFSGTGLAPDDEKKLKDATDKFLSFGGGTNVDGVKTAAGWAAAEVCKRVTASGADAIADADKNKHAAAVKSLTQLCGDKKLSAWFESRKRIGERTNVEIAQLGEGQPLPQTPYSEKQYDGVAKLYLQSALAAKRWPFITTHREEDKQFPGGHDDPRCFNVTHLYSLIASKMTHDPATVYGLEPVYGGPGDKNANVTWTKTLCHADPPKA